MFNQKRGLLPLPLILTAAGIFVLLIALALAKQSPGDNSGGGVSGQRVNVECEVTLENLGFDNAGAHIREFNCQKTGRCSLFSLSAGELGFFRSSTVWVQLYADDGVKSKPVKVEVTDQFITDSSKTVMLKACTASDSGSLKVYDKNNILLENKLWSVN